MNSVKITDDSFRVLKVISPNEILTVEIAPRINAIVEDSSG